MEKKKIETIIPEFLRDYILCSPHNGPEYMEKYNESEQQGEERDFHINDEGRSRGWHTRARVIVCFSCCSQVALRQIPYLRVVTYYIIPDVIHDTLQAIN